MSNAPSTPLTLPHEPAELSRAGRYVVLATAFLGWMGAGMEMSAIPARPAAVYFLSARAATSNPDESASPNNQSTKPKEADVGFWTAWFNGAFLLGAAVGGLIFGSIGDRLGRAKSMGVSILCYSLFMGAAYFSQSLPQLIGLRFLAGLGVGGMWPTGVALANEAWAGRSRGLVSGVIGMAANVGLSLMGVVCADRFVSIGNSTFQIGKNVTPDDWRWVMLVGSLPFLLGVLVLFVVPESPIWRRKRHVVQTANSSSFGAVFRPPHLKSTIIGIVLGAVPLFGGWGCVNWIVNWSDKVVLDPGQKADAQFMRSFGAIFGSFVGGWLATTFGRRTSYFFICLGSFLVSGYLFWFLTPAESSFLPWVFVVGLVATTAFGWLPLCLPELFPTEVRAAGSGVAFNFGRIFTAMGVLGTGFLMGAVHGDYALVGRVTHWIFVVGMIAILFAPDTSRRRMDD